MRYVVPALARKSSFDSALIGNSVCQPYSTDALDTAFGGTFANLCLGGGPFAEQVMVLRAFLLHHPSPRMIVWVMYLDTCAPDDAQQRNFTLDFPDFLYTGSPRGLEKLFNFNSVAQAIYQIIDDVPVLAGMVDLPPTHLPDSYLKSGDWNIYSSLHFDLSPATQSKRMHPSDATSFATMYPFTDERPFPRLDQIPPLFAKLPRETMKVFILPPVYSTAYPDVAGPTMRRIDECRSRLALIARGMSNGHFVDFFLPSPLATTAENFIDPFHALRDIAGKIIADTAQAVKTGVGDCINYRVDDEACGAHAARP